MKILISGANGFIGKNLLKALDQPGNSIFAFVRNRSKIRPEQISKNVIFFEADLAKTSSYIREVRDFNPEIVFHLAWDGIPDLGLRNSIKSLNMSKFFLKTIISETNCSKIIITGSCLEYGLKEGLLNEENPLQPTTFYGLAKISVLSMLKFFKHEFNLDFLWFRIFYVYGDNQNQRSLYPSLIRAIQNGESVFKMSHGNQMRDFIHINDVIKYFLYPLSNINMSGVFNISSGRSIKVKDFVNNIINSYGSDIKIEFDHYDVPSYEPMNFWGDNMKIKELEKLNNL